MGILVKDFLKWVGLANLIAWPVAYITMAQILRNYAYRVSIGVGAFIFSAVLVIAISFLTISFQTLKASRTKPVEALRYE
jgi:putative ABC transport system permease protein